MTKEEKIQQFDPNQPGLAGAGIFGLPFSPEESKVVIIPVPWEVTVSYGAGTAAGPEAILEASLQVDLYDARSPDAWKEGFSMPGIPEDLRSKSENLRELAVAIIEGISEGKPSSAYQKNLDRVNAACGEMVGQVRQEAAKLLVNGQIPVLLGGDHSSPLGLIQALADTYPDFGILQIDAHCDLRQAYEGFTYSHASIMYNALKLPAVTKLVQVGIRDYCQEEVDYARASNGRVKMFTDRELSQKRFEGESWKQTVDRIVDMLPQHVYISFDIDGLDPALCQHTGTPVPGGLSFGEALYLIEAVKDSGRQLISFDLCEVAPGADEWDANVGARLLYRLCNLIAE
jgi:agmatinase